MAPLSPGVGDTVIGAVCVVWLGLSVGGVNAWTAYEHLVSGRPEPAGWWLEAGATTWEAAPGAWEAEAGLEVHGVSGPVAGFSYRRAGSEVGAAPERVGGRTGWRTSGLRLEAGWERERAGPRHADGVHAGGALGRGVWVLAARVDASLSVPGLDPVPAVAAVVGVEPWMASLRWYGAPAGPGIAVGGSLPGGWFWTAGWRAGRPHAGVVWSRSRVRVRLRHEANRHLGSVVTARISVRPR